MTIKIERKIVKYQVQKPDEAQTEKAAVAQAASPEPAPAAALPPLPTTTTVRDKHGHMAQVIRMHEKLERPEVLIGSTYKIKTPISD
ncbi:MAG: hypothetical protein M0038_08165, partial [Pseudomonadota bacterium]|nr:hypothetical protein [Pseudomonadota bacterium]